MENLPGKNSGNGEITAAETADLFTFLASVLNKSPDETVVKNLRAYFADNGDGSLGGMEEFLKERVGVNDADIATELAVEWTHLFRGLSPHFGPPPPYTGVYISKNATGIETILAVKQAYKSENLIPDMEIKQDRADYLGFELEFMAHLARRMAAAEESSDSEKAREYGKKMDEFAKSFVTPWINEFAEKAMEYAKTSFFQGYLKLVSEAFR
jgi:TorA maturation chaperone TorD